MSTAMMSYDLDASESNTRRRADGATRSGYDEFKRLMASIQLYDLVHNPRAELPFTTLAGDFDTTVSASMIVNNALRLANTHSIVVTRIAVVLHGVIVAR